MRWPPPSAQGRLTGKEVNSPTSCRVRSAKRFIRLGFLFVSETTDPRTCYQRNTPDVKSSQYGLERVGVDFSKYPAFPEADRTSLETQDVYFLRDPTGVVSTLILCTAEEAKTASDGPAFRGPAHCEHKFISKKLNALISITYSRPLLKYWSEIQARWLSLIDSFASGERGWTSNP